MTTTPSSPAQQAREALGARLRELRREAGLTGRALAERIGCHHTKVSRIEHGSQAPSEANIRAWCRVCDADDQTADLLATARGVESMYVEWRRRARSGMTHLMLAAVPLYENTTLFRIYEHSAIPGPFQTTAYSAAVLEYFIDFLQLPNDVESAVAARMQRQQILYSGDRRLVAVIEEQALRHQVGSPHVMAEQLDRLLAVMSLPRISLGVIPLDAEHRPLTTVGFWIYDTARVGVETPTAKLDITQPSEVRLYCKQFEQLQQTAVYGPAARALITDAMPPSPGPNGWLGDQDPGLTRRG
ncbi:helix-turn-helix domain-containing protein [Dactylosporangium sp. NPDC048998]|uniref:helix-turn-helix domain-containing protein n=1 Tax=Dactylosporangium sp. NPDC048998 TaxID=3363976 RepID=UPI003716A4E4